MNNCFENLVLGGQEFNSQCSLMIEEIKDGKSNILNIVENLQPLLTNTSTEQRVKGITVLSVVLNGLPRNCIAVKETGILANFLCERLMDHHEVVPAVIKTLLVVINTENLSKGTAKRILSAIFHHIPCQQQQQSDRYNIYSVFKKLHETSKEDLKEMGLDLIYGIITAIDGERDPRNLLFLFNWLEEFLRDFELGHLSEEMFEVLACYFPVDFRPTSEDAITRETLARSLSKCLCGSQKFGDFIVPLALEKLDSELIDAKLDSLEVLELVTQKFPPDLALKYSTAIWAPIHKEILSTYSDELESCALKTLSSFVRSISRKSEANISSLLESMVLNVKGNATPDSKLFEASCKILFAMAASKSSSEYIAETIVPLWGNLYDITNTVKHRIDLLKVLCELCVITADALDTSFDNVTHLQNVPNLFLKALMENDNELKSETLRCFKKIARYLPREARMLFFENMEILLLLPLGCNQRLLVLDCLKEYAKLYPTEIENLIKSLKTKNNLKLYLEAIGAVLDIKQLWPLCIKELTCYALETTKDNSQLSLRILRKVIEEAGSLGLEEYLIEKEDFLFKLIDWFLIHSNKFNIDVDVSTLDDILVILYRIIAKLPENLQHITFMHIAEKIKTRPVEEIFVVWFGILIGLKYLELLNRDLWEVILNAAINTRYSYVNDILSQLIGNVLNKLNDDEIIDVILSEIEKKNSFDDKQSQNLFNILSFTIKGLVLRGHKDATIWTNKLLQLAGKHKEACQGFRIILDESYVSFSKFCCVKERLLYKQKFFSDVTSYVNTNCSVEDTNYFTVMAYLVQGIPESLLHMHITKVLRWIILYLDSSDDIITICNLCKIINKAILMKVGDVLKYTNEILKVYSRLSMKNSSMKVRIETLRGIRLFTELPVREIITQKQDVIKHLNVCVDDHKRLVRKEAMETRLKWYLIDSPI